MSNKFSDSVYQSQLFQKFNEASEISWETTHIGERTINPLKTSQYLENFRDSDKAFIQQVLDNTTYVYWDVLIQNLNKSFEQFVQKIENKPFFLLLTSDKFGSEIMLAVILWKKITKLNFQGFIDFKSVLVEGSGVLIIDDAIYTGQNIASVIDELTYKNRKKIINFHVVVPYISEFGSKQILRKFHKDQCPVIEMYPVVSTVALSSICENITDRQCDRFGLEGKMQVPMYFDHKVGNNFATFSTIYCDGIIFGGKKFGSLLCYDPDIGLKWKMYREYFSELLALPK